MSDIRLVRASSAVVLALATGILGLAAGRLSADGDDRRIQTANVDGAPALASSRDVLTSHASTLATPEKRVSTSPISNVGEAPSSSSSHKTLPSPSEAETIAFIEAAVATNLKQYDAELTAKPAMPLWWSGNDVYANVNAIDATSSVVDVACASQFCRVEILHSGPTLLEAFEQKALRQPAFQGGVIFRRAPDDPNRTFAYVFAPTADVHRGEDAPVPDSLSQEI